LIPTFSPQGDGNYQGIKNTQVHTWVWLIPTFSPQGDGNPMENTCSPLLTRKVDPYLFPARGRKHRKCISAGCRGNRVDPYLFPARGRKLCCSQGCRGIGRRCR